MTACIAQLGTASPIDSVLLKIRLLLVYEVLIGGGLPSRRQPGWGHAEESQSSDLSWGWANGAGSVQQPVSPQGESVTAPLTL